MSTDTTLPTAGTDSGETATLHSGEASVSAIGYPLAVELSGRDAGTGSSGLVGVGGVLPPVLDACCGPRFMWFDPKDGRALFMDRRRETVKGEWGPGSKGRRDLQIDPDVLADFSAMPFPDESFLLVVLDPPHIRRLEMLGKVSATFGVLVPGWEEMLAAGFRECFRVLRPGGTLIFKWCEVEVPLDRVLALTPEKPLFGHRSGKKALTHWVAFLKGGGGAEQVRETVASEPPRDNEKLCD